MIATIEGEKAMTLEFSGKQWCGRFLGSAETSELAQPFRHGVESFIASLLAGGSSIHKSATYRPPERAYLMHFACLVAGFHDKAGVFHQIDPHEVPHMVGVDIDWTFGGSTAAARSAASDMVMSYDIKFPAALVSRHTQRRGIDMTIHVPAGANIFDAHGHAHHFSNAATGMHPTVIAIGATFGVIKLTSDPPHWSDDGH